jgi:hypothetical protein
MQRAYGQVPALGADSAEKLEERQTGEVVLPQHGHQSLGVRLPDELRKFLVFERNEENALNAGGIEPAA